MATTEEGIYFPDDYSKIADVPKDMEKMAKSISAKVKEHKERIDGFKNYDDTNIKQDIASKVNQTDYNEAMIALQAENARIKKDYNAIAIESQAKGESLYLTDSSDARFKKFGICGNSKQENEPSLEYPSEIKTVKDSANVTVCNKNLCDNVFEQGTIDVSNGSNGTFSNAQCVRTKNFIRVKPNTKYTMTNPISNKTRKTRFYDKNKNYIGYSLKSGDLLLIQNNINSKKSGTTPDNAYYMRFELNFADAQTGQDVIDGKYKYQLEEGETATDYVAHEEQTFTEPVQQEMLEGDYLDLDSEEEVHTWGKVVLDGVNNKTNYKHDSVVTDTNGFYSIHLLGKSASYNDGNVEAICCSHLKPKKDVAINAVKENCIWWNGGNSEYVFLSLPFLSISAVNTYLQEQYNAGTPVTVYYKLETPTKLPFNSAQKAVAKQIRETIHSYKDGTHIFSTDEVSPVFNVEYAVDTKAYIKNKVTEIGENPFEGLEIGSLTNSELDEILI